MVGPWCTYMYGIFCCFVAAAFIPVYIIVVVLLFCHTHRCLPGAFLSSWDGAVCAAVPLRRRGSGYLSRHCSAQWLTRTQKCKVSKQYFGVCGEAVKLLNIVVIIVVIVLAFVIFYWYKGCHFDLLWLLVSWFCCCCCCSCQTVKTKEEKEVLEHFAGVVGHMTCHTHVMSYHTHYSIPYDHTHWPLPFPS